MPRATADTTTTVRKDLKTCPGGYVELRRMTYGQMLERRSMAANLKMPMNGNRKQDREAVMKLMDATVTLYEFSHCVVDHNLEDENGVKLQLNSQRDIQRLDPKIGSEIDAYISELNNFEQEDEENPTEAS
jgi:TRAP-type mannitol/chloroaromatic compound transport system substrate-binding protein